MKNIRKELDQTKNSYENQKNELKTTINQVSTNEREWKNKLHEREDELKKVGCSLRENSEINTKLEKELFEIKSQN
jgi:chromosome segregation ATPase